MAAGDFGRHPHSFPFDRRDNNDFEGPELRGYCRTLFPARSCNFTKTFRKTSQQSLSSANAVSHHAIFVQEVRKGGKVQIMNGWVPLKKLADILGLQMGMGCLMATLREVDFHQSSQAMEVGSCLICGAVYY